MPPSFGTPNMLTWGADLTPIPNKFIPLTNLLGTILDSNSDCSTGMAGEYNGLFLSMFYLHFTLTSCRCAIPITDSKTRVIGVCCGRPGDSLWDSVPKSAAETVDSARKAMNFSKKDLKHHQADTPAGAIGASFGSGQQVRLRRLPASTSLLNEEFRFQEC